MWHCGIRRRTRGHLRGTIGTEERGTSNGTSTRKYWNSPAASTPSLPRNQRQWKSLKWRHRVSSFSGGQRPALTKPQNAIWMSRTFAREQKMCTFIAEVPCAVALRVWSGSCWSSPVDKARSIRPVSRPGWEECVGRRNGPFSQTKLWRRWKDVKYFSTWAVLKWVVFMKKVEINHLEITS